MDLVELVDSTVECTIFDISTKGKQMQSDIT